MANEQQQTNVHRTASERLYELETKFQNLQDNLMSLAESLQSIIAMVQQHKETIVINSADIRNQGSLYRGLIVSLIKKGLITEDDVRLATTENNIAELAASVEVMKKNGVIDEADRVTPSSFIVAEEIGKDGNVINPRLQFFLETLPNEDQVKILDKVPGEVVNVTEGEESFRILEVYNIVRKAQAKADEPQA
jgi:hypothetical protein